MAGKGKPGRHKARTAKELEVMRAVAAYAHQVFLEKTPERQRKEQLIAQEIENELLREKIKKRVLRKHGIKDKSKLRRKEGTFKQVVASVEAQHQQQLNQALQDANATYQPRIMMENHLSPLYEQQKQWIREHNYKPTAQPEISNATPVYAQHEIRPAPSLFTKPPQNDGRKPVLR